MHHLCALTVIWMDFHDAKLLFVCKYKLQSSADIPGKSRKGGAIRMFTKRSSTSISRLFRSFSRAHNQTIMRNSIFNVFLGKTQVDTYSDKDTVQVHRFSPTLFSTPSAQYFCQAPGVVDSQDVDVILATESLNEGKVDLQGHVLDIIFIGR